MIQSGDYSVGVIHGNVPLSENFEGFQDKFNYWMITNQGSKNFLTSNSAYWNLVHRTWHDFMINQYIVSGQSIQTPSAADQIASFAQSVQIAYAYWLLQNIDIITEDIPTSFWNWFIQQESLNELIQANRNWHEMVGHTKPENLQAPIDYVKE